MKKLITLMLLIATIYVIGYCDHNYTRKECTVTNIDNNIVTIQDKQGHIWEWEKEANEQFIKGEKVNLKMFDNTTDETITDDIIKSVEKVGCQNMATTEGGFEELHTEDGTYYLFKSTDNKIWWVLSSEELGQIPEANETYVLYYDNNGTTDCKHNDCDNCYREDDIFKKIEKSIDK